MTLRSRLNSEEQPNGVMGPTRYRRGPNRSELICGSCGETFYVDDLTFRQAMSAMEKGDQSPFCCDECEEEHEELAH